MPPVRHSSVTTIAPTGTISRLADCSSARDAISPSRGGRTSCGRITRERARDSSDAPLPVRRALVADVGEETAEETLAQLANDPAWGAERLSQI